MLATAGIWLWDLHAERLTAAAVCTVVAWCCARRRIPAGVLKAVLLTSPPITVPLRATTSTTFSYLTGTATLARVSWGKPSRESTNLDRTYRAFESGGACNRDVSALVVARTKRATFLALFEAFGPMRGAYIGPYPSRERAQALAEVSQLEVDPEGWSSGELRIGDRRVIVGSRWRDSVGRRPPLRISATLSGDLALVVTETPTGRLMSLVDLGGFGWFATWKVAARAADFR